VFETVQCCPCAGRQQHQVHDFHVQVLHFQFQQLLRLSVVLQLLAC
jgi:hypothetical protein